MKRSRSGLALFSLVVLCCACRPALAGGGAISGSVRARSDGSGLPWVIITVRDANTGLLAGLGATDASGDYSIAIPAPGAYTLRAARLGYGELPPEPVQLSQAAPDPRVDLALDKDHLVQAQTAGPKPASTWGTGSGKSYLVPALELPAFLTLLSLYDRHAYPDQMENGKKVYSSTVGSTWDHVIHQHWVIDQDPFAINQFMHPYQGTIFHGFARSAGLDYWQALLYDNMGSFEWKMAGETDPPSINDQIATGIAGSFFGEALFRMANLLWEDDATNPSFLRKLGGIVASPSAGFNRYAFGDRFHSAFSSGDPAVFSWLQLGEGLQSNQNDQGVKSTSNRNQAMATFSLAYGLPGQGGYTYTRPFDYFQFEFDALANPDNTVDNVMIRGLLLGTDYEVGTAFDGIVGLYGGYDYISPYIFRVSSTSVSLGSTFQAQVSDPVTLQGSLLAGVGYGAAGNITPVGQRDYHYGVTPQALAALRLILGRRAMLDATERYYYVSGTGSDNPGGNESVHRLNTGLTIRLFGRQAIGIQYIASIRSAHFPGLPDSHQSVGTVALVYTLLGKTGFGAVK
jgi:hypothetical protein